MITTTQQHLDLSGEEKRALLARLLRHRANETDKLHPLSHGQRALWFMHQMAPRGSAYNEAFAWRIRSNVDVLALRRAFQRVLDRHAILRTTYGVVAGEPMQKINVSMPMPFATVDAAKLTQADVERLVAAEARRPFDLESDPMMRVLFISRSPRDHVLVLVLHHIAMDLWSMGVIVDDLRIFYATEKAGKQARLRSLDGRYVDFVRGQARMLTGPEGERLAAYWDKQLAGPLPDLDLPTDRPRPPVQAHRGASHPFAIGDDLARKVRDLAKAEGATPFMTMLAAFQVLLRRYTGQEDILVGSPTAGRTRPEWRSLVGYLVNPVVLRANVRGAASFKDFLAQVRTTVIGALQHQEYPFPLLVNRLQTKRDPSRSSLFQVNFAWEKPGAGIQAGKGAAATRLELDDLVLESIPLKQEEIKFDLTMMVLEAGRSLSATLQYNTDLWDAATIERMAGHYRMLLEGIVANPEGRIAELPLLTTEEKQTFVRWNDTKTAYPESACLHELVEAQADKTPQAVAVVQGETSLTYRELNERANRLAHYLRKLGVGPEVKVALCPDRSVDTIVALFGILKAGGAYVPVDLAYPKDRLAFMLEDAQAPILLTMSHLALDLPAGNVKVLCLEGLQGEITKESAANPAGGATIDNLAYVIYTSGSTGRPKGVLVTHRGIGNLAQEQIKAFTVTSRSRVLQFASLSFDASVSDMVMALCAGATLVLGTPESLMPGPGLVRLLREQAVTTVTLPPSVLASLPADDLPDLLTVAAAGEACTAEIVAKWALGRRFLNAYGPTENTVCASVALCEPDGTRPTIGKPIGNVQVHILDAHMQPMPIGVPGELHLGGIGLARGYHNRPELTAERFVANPFTAEPGDRLYKTGDLARWLPDGTIEFLGRLDHQVKIRGFRIELGEIEATLAQRADVGETVVLARRDHSGERLVAYFVADPIAAPSVSELRRFLKEKLPEYMVPAAFVRMDALPLSPNGKIDRNALPAPDASRPQLEQAFEAPVTPVQVMLAEIFAQVLGIEKVGIFDNFFELGGASIQTLQVAERASAMGLAVTPEMVFQFQTIAELEAACEACFTM